MGFTQKCFIRKNTPGLRKKIKEIERGISLFYETMEILAADSIEVRAWDNEWNNDAMLIRKGYIDCGTNEELFLAIAALRDDSDKHQWFTDGYSWVQSQLDSFCSLSNSFDEDEIYKHFYKADAEELIENFI